jgi:hypothetical protein
MPRAAIAIVDVLEPSSAPDATAEESGETPPGADAEPEPEGEGDTVVGVPVGVGPGEVGVVVGLVFFTTTTRPHIPQFGNAASLPCIWQWYVNVPRSSKVCE